MCAQNNPPGHSAGSPNTLKLKQNQSLLVDALNNIAILKNELMSALPLRDARLGASQSEDYWFSKYRCGIPQMFLRVSWRV